MHLLLILLGFAVAMVAIVLFFTFRPGLRKVKGGLNYMFVHGFDGAEFRFIHPQSGRQLAFRLRLVGGVKQLYFLVDRLQLASGEHAVLMRILDQRGLKLQTRRNKAKSEFVNVGHSPELTNDLACQVASEIMHWTGLTRFKYEDNFFISRSKKWKGP